MQGQSKNTAIGSNSSADLVCLLALVTACALVAASQWLIGGLYGDPGIWQSEAYRVSLGDLPYRDFMWTAPPLGIAVLGLSLRWFGATWLTAQLVLTILSGILIWFLWKLARRLVPEPLAAASIIFYLATSVVTPLVSMFSLSIYTPAILTGMAGFSVYLYGLLTAVRDHESSRAGRLAMILGAAVSLLSKPEFAAAVLGCQIAWSISDWGSQRAKISPGRWLVHHAAMFLLCVAPAGVGYLITAQAVGGGALWQGITGYGQTGPCPWWPTGEGLVSGMGALGLAVFLYLVFRGAESFDTRLRIASLAALAVWLVSLRWTGWSNFFPADVHPGWFQQIRPAMRFAAWHYLHAVLWGGIALLAGCALELVAGLFRRKEFSVRFRLTLMLLCAGVGLSCRALFSHTIAIHPVLADAAIPFLCVLGPFLLCSEDFHFPAMGSRIGSPARISMRLPLTLSFTAFVLFFFAGELKTSRDFPVERVHTRAGWIGFRQPGLAESYRILESKTRPGDWIIELPYGGGLTMAAHLRPAVFSTGYRIVSPGPDLLQEDLALATKRTPGVVVWETEGGIHFGGLPVCPIPSLVWNPSTSQPAVSAPLYEWVKSHYRPTAEIAGHTLYEPAALTEERR